jgi:hypothetical protein
MGLGPSPSPPSQEKSGQVKGPEEDGAGSWQAGMVSLSAHITQGLAQRFSWPGLCQGTMEVPWSVYPRTLTGAGPS